MLRNSFEIVQETVIIMTHYGAIQTYFSKQVLVTIAFLLLENPFEARPALLF